MWSVLKLAARAAIWRTTPEPRLAGLPSLLILMLCLAFLRVAFQFVAASPTGSFNPYGLNAAVTWLALEAAVAALFVPPPARVTALSALFALSLVAELFVHVFTIGSQLLLSVAAASWLWSSSVPPIAIFAVVSAWWIGAMVAVLTSLAPQSRLRLFGRAVGLWIALLAVTALVPHAPVFIARDFDIRTANWWESLRAQRSKQSETVQFDQTQGSLLQTQVARLAPPTKGKTNIYAIGLAGWADQDVFLKELDGGLAALGDTLPIREHTLRLVNHRETRESLPLATQRNFAAAVHAIGQAMDKNDDVLLLLMTSHGEKTGFGLRLPNEVLMELTPQDVAVTLNNEGIKNRVVVVSACFAGIFVPPLATDDSIVLTAADANSTSFGCAPERDWTYFGDAFFKQSVRPGRDLRHAFDNARALIHGWEMMDRAAPSNPQGHFGPALVAKLAPFFASAPDANQ